MKYARIVVVGSGLGVVDLFTTDASDDSTPMKIPANASPLAWLNQMFSGFSDQFAAQNAQFRQVPSGVKPAAVFTGDRTSDASVLDGTKYINTDNTDGNGGPIV